jgi:hypothetical protein
MEMYSADMQMKMRRFFGWLSEKDRRRYAAIEVAKLGHGGVEYIARLLGCDVKTIRQGLRELEEAEDRAAGRIRKKGGGRPPCTLAEPKLEANLRHLLQEFTGGDPMREGVLWTNLSLRELSRRLLALGTPVSRRTIRRLLRHLQLGCRTARKKKTMGHHPDRNAQFENIARLRREYEAAGEAVISIDTKKKELLGNFHRPGTTFTATTVATFDHDFGSAGQGKLIPHGVYDLIHQHAHIHLNTSHDTSELCCDSIALWWEQAGRTAYPQAKRLLVLSDGGGSNSASQYLFKEDLQRLANRLGLEVRVAHYPPYCSKYNPIEHHVFPHITRACQGVIFHTVDIARRFIERAKTTTGLHVTVRMLDKMYQTGRKYAVDFKRKMKIVFDNYLPRWNYRAVPELI